MVPTGRRTALRLGLGALLAAAGCATRTTVRSPTSTPTDDATPTETAAATPPREPIGDVRAVPELVAPNSPDSIDVAGERGEQFLLVETRDGGDAAPPRDLEFVADDRTFGPVAVEEATPYGALWDDDGYVTRPATSMFVVPKPLGADKVALRWESGRRSLASDVLARLRRPPTEFAVELTAPGSVPPGSSVTVEMTVRNVGTVDGRFVGALNRQGPEVAYTPVEGVWLDLPAGESNAVSYTYDGGTSAGDEMRISLVWRDGRAATTIAVEER